MLLDFEILDETKAYKVMSYSIFPRPIAWIITQDDGVVNIAPFSYFAPLSSKPPIVIVSIGLKDDGEPKDTRANIIKHKKATICLADKEALHALSASSSPLSHDKSEAAEFDIKTKTILADFPPIVEDVKGAYFCELYKICEIDGSETLPIMLKIKNGYFADGVSDEKLNIELENVGRVGREFLVDAKRVVI